MRFHRSFHIRSVSIVLVLVLSILGLVPLTHAAGITFKSSCTAETSSGTTINCALSGVGASDTVIVNIFGVGIFNSFVVTDGQSNAYTQQVFSVTGGGS